MTAPEIAPPLAALGGTTPPAPAWFHEMLALAPERRFHEVDGARIETLAWGEHGRPRLLFLHGNAAHADWWSFIAPFFLPQYRVVALTSSCIGEAVWREAYSLDGFDAEALMIAELGGRFATRTGPRVGGDS